MPFFLPAIAAGIGAVAGAIKSGSDLNMTGRNEAGNALNAYKNLVGKGPGESDVAAATGATRDFAQTLNNTASSGLYDQSRGNQLAEQQFAGQRQQLAQSLQDQMAVANRAASSAGRSSNDPILRARLGAEAMRQTASLNAQQSSAAMDLGRQSTLDMLSLGGQRVNVLQGLSQQAFAGQQNLFNMGQNLQSMDTSAAQYEQGRGGGLKGAITGAIQGAGAGMQMASGFANLSAMGAPSGAAAGQISALNNFQMGPNQSMESIVGAGARGLGQGAAQGMMAAPSAPGFGPATYFNPASYAQGPASLPASSVPRYGPSDLNYMRSYWNPFSLPPAPNGAFGVPNSASYK